MKYLLIVVQCLLSLIVADKYNYHICLVNENSEHKFYEFACEPHINWNSEAGKNCSQIDFYGDSELISDNVGVSQLRIKSCEPSAVLGCIKHYRHLKSLDISCSGYWSLNAFNLKQENLLNFNASQNELTDIPMRFFDKVEKILEIDFSFNQIMKIESSHLEGATKLTTIHMANNKIIEIDINAFSKLENLLYVDLRNNRIFQVWKIFESNRKLDTLHLENNMIGTVPIIDANSIYLSWKEYVYFLDIGLEINDGFNDVIHVVVDDKIEGIFRKSKGLSELHCSVRSFNSLTELKVDRIKIDNVIDLLQCLDSPIQLIDLSGSIVHRLNESTFNRFGKLQALFLNSTNLKYFNFNALKHQISTLRRLDISHNNLQHLENVNILQNFKKLYTFKAAGNQFKNITEIIQQLKTVVYLDLSENAIGGSTINFRIDNQVSTLKMRDSNLSLVDFDPFEQLPNLSILDVSDNNMKNVNFTVLSKTLRKLIKFYAAGCQIGNRLGEVLEYFGPLLRVLDLSRNVAAGKTIETLNLSTLNLVNVFDLEMTYLNISYNNAKKVIFSSTSIYLKKLDLQGNELTEVSDINSKHFPLLSELNISQNQFSCEYLIQIASQLEEWLNFRLIDPWKQKHGDCNPRTKTVQIETTSSNDWDVNNLEGTERSIPAETNSILAHSIVIVVSFFAVMLFLNCYFIFRVQFCKKTQTSNYDTPKATFEKGEVVLEIATVQEVDNSNEHIYEEICEPENPYDHLEFSQFSKPKETDDHYSAI